MTDLKQDKKLGRLKINDLIIPGSHHSGLTEVIPDMDLIKALANNLGLADLLDYAP